MIDFNNTVIFFELILTIIRVIIPIKNYEWQLYKFNFLYHYRIKILLQKSRNNMLLSYSI